MKKIFEFLNCCLITMLVLGLLGVGLIMALGAALF